MPTQVTGDPDLVRASAQYPSPGVIPSVDQFSIMNKAIAISSAARANKTGNKVKSRIGLLW